MSYGKKVGKFKPNIPSLQGCKVREEKKIERRKSFLSQSLRIESFFLKSKF
jgi:hypothetical protein